MAEVIALEQLKRELQEEQSLDVDPMTEITVQPEMLDKTVARRTCRRSLMTSPCRRPSRWGR